MIKSIIRLWTLAIVTIALSGTASCAATDFLTAVHGGDVKDAIEGILRDTVANTIGQHFAEKIGKMYRPPEAQPSELNVFTHKAAHALLGGITGAMMTQDPEKGALAGAIGAATAECIADGLGAIISAQVDDLRAEGYTQDQGMEMLQEPLIMGGHVAKLSAGVAALLAGQDVDVALKTGQTAVDHNFLWRTIPFLIEGALILWAAADVCDLLEEAEIIAEKEGETAALKHLGQEGLIVCLGGSIFKIAGKTIQGTTKAWGAARKQFFKNHKGANRKLTLHETDKAKKALAEKGKEIKKEGKIGKNEQPWTVRPGQEWKKKVVGRAQETDTQGHVFASYREAVKAAKEGDTIEVLMNRGYNKAASVKIKSNRRPDVIIKKNDGKVHPREVPSRTDDPIKLMERNKEALDKLPEEIRGKYKRIDIRTEDGILKPKIKKGDLIQ